MIYFRWQPCTSLQNFIHLRQSAAELLMFVQKIYDGGRRHLEFIVFCPFWSIGLLPCCKISFIYANRRLSYCCLYRHLGFYFCLIFWHTCMYDLQRNTHAEFRSNMCNSKRVDEDDDDDDEGRINFSMALSPKTTRTRNNKPKQ